MHRNKVISLLNRYQPTILKEIVAKTKMLEFIQTNENCFERTLEIGHITGSAWLLNKNLDQALLIHHAKLNKWFQLGGHDDGDSDILNVAIKEAQEESGILAIEAVIPDIFDIDIHEIPANKKDQVHFHYDIRFLLKVTSNEEIQINEEAKALAWIGKDESKLPTIEESILRMHQKWISLIK